ncbi:branched-chain amino acid ABC transporter permease [Bradyrhizobium sp. ISRA435]|nr:branched-chain amino acid ABC transporter permease [Bradyrhizobium sp. ISRA435]
MIGAVAGAILEATIIRPLYHRTFDALLATFAVSLIVQQGIELLFGAQPQIVSAPVNGAVSILGTEYPVYRVLVIVLATATVALFLLVFTRTRFGTDLRAVIQNPEMAEAVGIDTRRLNRAAFAGGAALAAFAGALIAPLASVESHLGLFYLGKAFFIIVLGGIGSIFGSLLGSALVGTSETLLDYVVDPSLASAVVLILAVLLIRIRPRGLIPGFSAAHQLLGRE